MGGEEFAIIMPNLSLADAPRFAERLRAEIEAQRFPWNDGSISLTASIGVAEVQADRSPIGTALSAADAALYRAKQQGRNRVAIAGGDPSLHRKCPFTVVQGAKTTPRPPA